MLAAAAPAAVLSPADHRKDEHRIIHTSCTLPNDCSRVSTWIDTPRPVPTSGTIPTYPPCVGHAFCQKLTIITTCQPSSTYLLDNVQPESLRFQRKHYTCTRKIYHQQVYFDVYTVLNSYRRSGQGRSLANRVQFLFCTLVPLLAALK